MSVFQRPGARRIAAVVLVVSAIGGFIRVDQASHSVSDTLYGVVPLWIVCLLAWWWVRRLGRPDG